jgi:iron complex transport system substrate-binding protein
MAILKAAKHRVPMLLALLLAGCGQSSAPPSPAPADAAKRIVSLAPHLTEWVFAAGAGDRLVGTVEYSDYPAAAAEVPRIGDAFRVDYEAIGLLRPDLVLAWRSGTPRETVVRLQSLGFRVVELDAGRLEDTVQQLRAIGRLTGTGSAAEGTALELEAAIAALQARYSGRAEVAAFIQIESEPLFTVTGAHLISDIIASCGGRNIFADLPGVAPPVSMEAVVAANPDVILATGTAGETDWMQRWQGLTQMTAVQRGQLYTLDRNLITRSGPRIVDGALEVCAALDRARDNPAGAPTSAR